MSVSSSRPNSVAIALTVQLILGIVAIVISGIMEVTFMTDIDDNFIGWGVALAFVCEGGKATSMYLYEYSKKSSSISRFSTALSASGWILRFLLFGFSCFCCFAKIAKALDTPNYKSVLSERKTEIDNEYKERLENEEAFLNSNVDRAYRSMENEANIIRNGQWKGSHYEEKKALYETAKTERVSRLTEITRQKDSLSDAEAQNLQHDIKSENKLVQGVYRTLIKSGMDVNSSKFAAGFNVFVGLIITAIIELIIWTVFGTMGSVKGDLNE